MIVDALLDLLAHQGADALVLESNLAPSLAHGKTLVPLSMPPLDADILSEIFVEVGAELGATEYSVSGKLFTVLTEAVSSGRRLTFRVADRENIAEPPAQVPVAASDLSVARGVVPSASPAKSPALVIAPQPAADGQPANDPMIERVLERAEFEQASDVFLSSGRDCHLRVGGEIVVVPRTHLSQAQLLAYLAPLWTERMHETLASEGSVDLALTRGEGRSATRYRVNVFRELDGLAAALRPIRREAPTLNQLGLPEDLHRLAQFRNGLVLMTGTTGSGKSTTLVALLERLNRTTAKHIITIEDPIEYRFEVAQALVHQREVGVHVRSFAAGLRAALREAPDVILVGEMRDRETIGAALTAAETGHLVLSTLHCSDSASAVERIIDVFPEHQQPQVRYQLAGALRAVVSQTLLPTTSPPARVVAYEKLLVNTAVAAKIREQRTHQLRSELHVGRAEGMVPMEVSLAGLLRRGQITREVALAAAPDPKLLGEHV